MTTVYTFNNKVLKNSANDKWLKKPADPLNPLGLPPNTIRVKFNSGYTPPSTLGDTQTLVDSTNNIWDIYKDGTKLTMLAGNTNLLEVLGANTSNITDMSYTFSSCTALTNVALFDTSNVTNMLGMFDMYYASGTAALASVPLFDTSKVTNMISMFYKCINVQSGALALYQQASSQANPPAQYTNAFGLCGSNTVTGAAELAQIPSSWGGTGA